MRRSARVAGSLLATGVLAGTALAAGTGTGFAGAATTHSGAARAATTRALARSVGSTFAPGRFVLGAVTKDLLGFDRAVRHRATLRDVFMVMGSSNFPAAAILKNAALGAETMLALQPKRTTLTNIWQNGSEDNWLRTVFAPGVAALGIPITVSFAPEMNGQWYNWGHGKSTPQDFQQAWQHIYTVLAGTPAGHLINWMWQPSAIHYTTPNPMPYFPGSAYVNEIGVDGYFARPWDTFNKIFADTIMKIRQVTNLPILIGETAVGPNTNTGASPHQQIADIKDLFVGIRQFHLTGLVWFNITQHDGVYHEDWRLQDSPAALRTFISQVSAAERPVSSSNGPQTPGATSGAAARSQAGTPATLAVASWAAFWSNPQNLVQELRWRLSERS